MKVKITTNDYGKLEYNTDEVRLGCQDMITIKVNNKRYDTYNVKYFSFVEIQGELKVTAYTRAACPIATKENGEETYNVITREFNTDCVKVGSQQLVSIHNGGVSWNTYEMEQVINIKITD